MGMERVMAKGKPKPMIPGPEVGWKERPLLGCLTLDMIVMCLMVMLSYFGFGDWFSSFACVSNDCAL